MCCPASLRHPRAGSACAHGLRNEMHLCAPRQRQKLSATHVAEAVGKPHVHLAYPCQLAEISKEKGECSMLGKGNVRGNC